MKDRQMNLKFLTLNIQQNSQFWLQKAYLDSVYMTWLKKVPSKFSTGTKLGKML
jgi:hypothetical protein